MLYTPKDVVMHDLGTSFPMGFPCIVAFLSNIEYSETNTS